MKVTLDTNVLVSAFISKNGLPADILDLVVTFDEIELVLSNEILEEFTSVMTREEVKGRFGLTESDIARFETAIRDVSQIIHVKSTFRAVDEDPADDMILNTALDGKVDYIVSGDKHLRKLKRFKGVKIVNPRAFMTTVTKKFGDVIVSMKDLR